MLQMPNPLPDWAMCINCKNNSRNGIITHSRTCPDYRKPDTMRAKKVRVGDLLTRR